MAGFLADAVLDAALQYIEDNANILFVCSTQPTTYEQASSTYALGSAGVTFTGPADHTSGRKTTIDAILAGTIGADGTATAWSIVKTSTSALLAAQALGTAQVVTSGNTFTLGATIIAIPDPTA